MASKISIAVSNHFEEFLDERIASGRFESKSEAIQEGLRLLEARENEVTVLRNALIAGENSGTPKAFSEEEFLNEMKARYVKNVAV